MGKILSESEKLVASPRSAGAVALYRRKMGQSGDTGRAIGVVEFENDADPCFQGRKVFAVVARHWFHAMTASAIARMTRSVHARPVLGIVSAGRGAAARLRYVEKDAAIPHIENTRGYQPLSFAGYFRRAIGRTSRQAGRRLL